MKEKEKVSILKGMMILLMIIVFVASNMLYAQDNETKTNICPNCNTVNSVKALYCIHCGQSLKELSVSNNPQNSYQTEKVTFAQKNLGGPRLGVTLAPNIQSYSEFAKKKEIGELVSQFGWHFEYQVVPEAGGPSFVIQLVPMLGGVEYGTIIPSMSLVLGIRFPFGFEFGLGPNVLVIGGKEVVKSGLVMGIGQSFNYGGVSIPVNVAFVKGPEGNRFSFIFGYAIPR